MIKIKPGEGTNSFNDPNAIHKNVDAEIHAIPEKLILDDADRILLEDSAESTWEKKSTPISSIANQPDPDAIHKNVNDEIHTIPEKLTLDDADRILLEDSAGSTWEKKSTAVSNLPSQHDATAIHENVDAEIDSIVEKTTPVGTDILIGEDSDGGTFDKKKFQIANLPVKTDPTAIHSNVSDEIHLITEKVIPDDEDCVLIEDSEDHFDKKSLKISSWPIQHDPTAVHLNVDSEFRTLPPKPIPVNDDLLIIENSNNGTYDKNFISIGELPVKHDPASIHKDVAAEISTITEKLTPIGADLLLIEDSESGPNDKKRIQISNLPGTGGITTGANVGSAGVGPYKQVLGSEIQFFNIAPGSPKITIQRTGNNIYINTAPSVINISTTVALTDEEVNNTVITNNFQLTPMELQLPPISSGMHTKIVMTSESDAVVLKPAMLDKIFINDIFLPEHKGIIYRNVIVSNFLDLTALEFEEEGSVWFAMHQKGEWEQMEYGFLITGHNLLQYFNDCMRYDFYTDTWASYANIIDGDRSAACSASYDNCIYVWGGVDTSQYFDFNSIYHVYGSSVGWTTGTVLAKQRYLSTSSAMDYTGLIFGGRDNTQTPILDTDAYNIILDSWSTKTNMVGNARAASSANIFGSALDTYVLGGIDNSSAALTDNNKYALAFDSWEVRSVLPFGKYSAFIQEKGTTELFLYGGFIGNPKEWTTGTHRYNPAGNFYFVGISMPSPGKAQGGEFSIFDNIYACGGSTDETTNTNTSYYFNNVTSTWHTNVATFTNVRQYPVGVSV